MTITLTDRQRELAQRTTPSFHERVYWAISVETPLGHIGAMDVLHDYPEPSSDEVELDLIDWGFAYGVAYALAMLEADRFEPEDGPAIRAGEAARAAYERMHTVVS